MPLPSLQRIRATLSRDPATASFKNDQTLNLNSTRTPSVIAPIMPFPWTHFRSSRFQTLPIPLPQFGLFFLNPLKSLEDISTI